MELSSSCIIVENIESFNTFVADICSLNVSEIVPNPIKYAYVEVSDRAKIMIVQKDSCSDKQLKLLSVTEIRHLTFASNTIDKLRKISISSNYRIIDDSDNVFIFQGPEKINFIVTSSMTNKSKSPYETLLQSMSKLSSDSSISQSTNIPSSPQRTIRKHISNTPTIEAAILTNNGKEHVVFSPNSKEPIPFETESFKGHAMLVVRTDPIDPLFKTFFDGRRRRFEVQVQGKFKCHPTGEVYVGAETSNKMELGLITRSVSNAACNFCATLVNNLHYSFGDESPNKSNQHIYQVPHIVSPLFPTFDKVIITPPGEIPPKIGIPFIEDSDFRKKRCEWHAIKDANIDLNTIYSFSVNTSNIDLLAWQLMNIPMVRPMDIRTFIGDNPIFLVGYEIPKTVQQAHPTIHPKPHLKYMFSIRITPMDADKIVDLPVDTIDAADSGGDIDNGDDDNNTTTNTTEISSSILSVSRNQDVNIVVHDNDEDDDDRDVGGEEDEAVDDDELDEKNANSPTGASGHTIRRTRFLTNRSDQGTGGVGSWFKRRIDDMKPDALDIPETNDYIPTDYTLENILDLRFCPMSVEIVDRRIIKNSRRRTYYLLPWSAQTTTTSASISMSATNNTPSTVPGVSTTTTNTVAASVQNSTTTATTNTTSTTTSGTSTSTVNTSKLLHQSNIPVHIKNTLHVDTKLSLTHPSATGATTTTTSNTTTGLNSVDTHHNLHININTPTSIHDITTIANDLSIWSQLSYRIRSYNEIIKLFPMSPLLKSHKNKKMSSQEKRRRHIVESYKRFLIKNNMINLSTYYHNDNSPIYTKNTMIYNISRPNSPSTTNINRYDMNSNITAFSIVSPTQNTSKSGTLTTQEIQARNDGSLSPKPTSTTLLSLTSPVTSNTTNTNTTTTNNTNTIIHQLNQITILDSSFLENSYAPIILPRKKQSITHDLNKPIQKWEGTVMIATSSRHWSENIIRITYDSVSLLFSHESLRPYITIQRTSIYNIRALKPEETPLFYLDIFGFFQIETFARIYYFMVKKKYLNAWLSFFYGLPSYGPSIVPSLSPQPIEIVYKYPDPAEAYIARPSTWRLDKKRVYNYRKILFSSKAIDTTLLTIHPNILIENILQSAFTLATAEYSGKAEVIQWINFLDQLSLLQYVNIVTLSEMEKMTFLLNLYHLMVIHVSLIVGPPASWASWPGFFSASYIFSFDIVSIAEVEYNMLRAGMIKPPSTLQSKISIPHSIFPDLAVSQHDFRLIFCINNGANSMLRHIPIFQVTQLDKQLDQYTSATLREFVKIDSSKKTVLLPKVCSLFLHEIVSRRIQNPTSLDCLRCLVSYLKQEDRNILIPWIMDNIPITIKYIPYDFHCRQLTQYSYESITSTSNSTSSGINSSSTD